MEAQIPFGVRTNRVVTITETVAPDTCVACYNQLNFADGFLKN